MHINYFLTVFIGVLLFTLKTFAIDGDVDAGANFIETLQIDILSNADFGTIGFDSDATGAFILNSQTATLTCSNTVAYTCPSSGVRGSFRVTGTAGSSIDVSCETEAILTNGAASIKIFANSFYAGTGIKNCSGLGVNPYEHVLDANPADNVFNTGHVLVVQSGALTEEGVYSTANAGGDPIKFSVVYK